MSVAIGNLGIHFELWNALEFCISRADTAAVFSSWAQKPEGDALLGLWLHESSWLSPLLVALTEIQRKPMAYKTVIWSLAAPYYTPLLQREQLAPYVPPDRNLVQGLLPKASTISHFGNARLSFSFFFFFLSIFICFFKFQWKSFKVSLNCNFEVSPQSRGSHQHGLFKIKVGFLSPT